MKINSVVTALILFFTIGASAANVPANNNVAQMILGNSQIMNAVGAKIKSILPSLTMKFSGIEVNSSPSAYSAIMTYTDTAKGTFFNPAFGTCSVLVRGMIINNSSVSLISIKENDCGE
jgi:hypothetical protein